MASASRDSRHAARTCSANSPARARCLPGPKLRGDPRVGTVDQARQRAEFARERREQARRDVAEAQPLADATRRRSSELAERVGAMRGELDALHERAERGGRLGSLLSAAGWTMLLDTLQAPQEAWPAIEAVVGGELELALVWRDADLIDRLRDAHGAARLLVAFEDAPDDGKERAAALSAVGGSQTLAEWIRAPSNGLRLFRRTVVAPDLPSLLDGWRSLPSGWLAVTPGGDVADGRGMVSVRGRADSGESEAARRHARRRELGEAVERLEAEQEAATAEAASRMAAVGEAARQLEEAQRNSDRAEADERGAIAAAAEVEERRRRASATLERLTAELHAVDLEPTPEPASGSPATTGRLEEAQAVAEQARAERKLAAEARDAARTAWQEAERDARSREERQVGKQRERAMLEARRSQLQADLPRHASARETVGAELQEAERLAAGARAADDEAAEARTEAERAQQEARGQLLELERGSSSSIARLSELERAAQVAAVEASRQDEALASLARERELALDSLPELDQGDDESVPPAMDDIAALDDASLETELRRVRRTLAQIGSVNPFAVEEHRELSTRLEELSGQEGDLTGAIGSTEELIAHLDGQIAEQFNAAFAAIGERFDEFCRLLFAGGSASLTLGDGSDGEAAGGIEIVVRPPGKRLQRLAMLSGGERALTGVALLFAMLSVNPVPFCILDEVDAALDEANIGRFADALRKLAERIDFVVITHNRATIEVADTIYGVTMTDAAVSKIVSLRLADLPAEAIV